MSKARRANNFTDGIGNEDENAGEGQGSATTSAGQDAPPPDQPPPLADSAGASQGAPAMGGDAPPVIPPEPVVHIPPEKTLPGFAMVDVDDEVTTDDSSPPIIDPAASSLGAPARPDAAVPQIAPIDAHYRDRHGAIRYEGRIQIIDAYQYNGSLENAPVWIDRNWLAYADHDPLREIDAGPALRVPLASGMTAICRKGDYVTRQSITMVAGLPGDERIEVWAREDFQKNFMPVAA